MDDFINMTHYIDGDRPDNINVKRSGAFNISLIKRLTAESVSDDWVLHNLPMSGNITPEQLASGDFLSYTLTGLSPSQSYSVKLVTVTNSGDVFDPASVVQRFITRDCSND